MASGDKALKALQDGIDADAQPAALLEELLQRHSSGENLKEIYTSVLENFPHAAAMLNSKQTIGTATPAAAALLSSFSTPAPKTRAAVPAKAGACDETIAEDDGNGGGNNRAEAEETVMFGAKLSAAKGAPPSSSTPARSATSTPKPAAGHSTSASEASNGEDTVTFGSKITTPGAEARVAASGAMSGAAGDKADGKAALKKGAVRSVKRTGLGGGPARRVNPADAAEGEVLDDEKTDEPATPAAPARARVAESGGIRTTPLAYKSSLNGGCVVEGLAAQAGGRETIMGSSDLPPISEQDGRVSGEGVSTTSPTAAGGSSESIADCAASQRPRPMSEDTTQFLGANSNAPPQQLLADNLCDMQTQPVLPASDGHAADSHDAQEQAHRAEALPRHAALVEGHRPHFSPGEVPKGFIAVRDTLYRKIEVKGKGGGGKVYKVCLKDDESSIFAIKKIKLDGDEDLRACVLNEIELLVALRGESSIIHMQDFEVGEDYVHMVMECGEQDLAQALQRKQVRASVHKYT